MSRDDLNDIPSFAANRDEAVSSAPRGAIPARAARTEAAMGLTARLVLTIALAAAGIACGWAWQLQTLLDTSQTEQKETQARVADLEALLSDTDETVNKSAAAMGAQLRLLDTEVRKLWDARKVSNSKFTRLEKNSVTQEKQITGLNTKATTQGAQLASMQADLAALTQVAGDLERLAASAQRAQTDVERLACRSAFALLLSKMLFALLFTIGTDALLRNNLIPADTQRELMAAGSGKVDDEDLAPACSMIGCADIQCIPPLVLQRRPGQCCPICWAPDHEVPLDRHSAIKSEFVMPVHAGAPPTCAGAKCFKLLCIAGQMPGYVPGSCCKQCK